jgi:hypothetical protein
MKEKKLWAVLGFIVLEMFAMEELSAVAQTDEERLVNETLSN